MYMYVLNAPPLQHLTSCQVGANSYSKSGMVHASDAALFSINYILAADIAPIRDCSFHHMYVYVDLSWRLLYAKILGVQ